MSQQSALASFSRYVRLDGTFFLRKKKERNGSVPHYLVAGVEQVRFDSKGNPEDIIGVAMAIEAGFNEVKPPIGRPRDKNPLLLVQLVCGGNGTPASPAEARMLDELGRVLDALTSKRQPIILIAAPIATSEQYGMASGRFAPVGIFDEHEHALWLHPAAVAEGIIKAEWPESQVCRTLEVSSAAVLASGPQSGPFPGWYNQAVATLTASGVTGEPLMRAACQGQGNLLLSAGQVATLQEGVERAKTELRESMAKMGMSFPWLEPEAPASVPSTGKASARGPKRETANAASLFGGDSDASRAMLSPGKPKKKK